MCGKILFLMCAALLVVPSGISQGQTSDVSVLLKRADALAEQENYEQAEAAYRQVMQQAVDEILSLEQVKETTI